MTADQQFQTIIPKHWLHCGELYFDAQKNEMIYMCTQCVATRDKQLIINNMDFVNSNCFTELTQFCAHKLMHFREPDITNKENENNQIQEKTLDMETDSNPEPNINDSFKAPEPRQKEENAPHSSNALQTNDTQATDLDQQIPFSPFDPDSVQEFLKHERRIKERRTTTTTMPSPSSDNPTTMPPPTSDNPTTMPPPSSDNPTPITYVDLTSEDDSDKKRNRENLSLIVTIRKDRIRSLPQTEAPSDFNRPNVLTILTPESSPQPLPAETDSNLSNLFQCDECSVSFCNHWQLVYHNRLHKKKERRRNSQSVTAVQTNDFKCGLCPETFPDDDELRKHMCWHMDFSKPDELDDILEHLDGDGEPKSIDRAEPPKKRAKKSTKPRETKTPKQKIAKEPKSRKEKKSKKEKKPKHSVTLYECNAAAQRALAPTWMVSVNNANLYLKTVRDGLE